ncbi:hypothetical protein KP509_1Z076600 [Ceratopteris richardii]|nr:hypothetical protein KP509_1Z076600 [Ceratopteris richardii]KAH6558161.1 hypothetical protein KP509_1Z076600 [Ceratopteris richardii]
MDPSFRTRGSAMMTPIAQTMASPSSMSSSSSGYNGVGQLNRLRSGDSRFMAGSFQYNIRIGLALVPCGMFLVSLGGKQVLGTLTVGLMLSYILDALHVKHGAFFGIWGSLFASMLAFIISGTSFYYMVSLPLYCLALLLSFQVIFLIGVWASLQFKWLQLENPSVVLALERVLFACVPFAASAVQTWAIVAAVGIVNAPFYLMVILFGMYWLYALPRQSSFKKKPEKKYGGIIADDALILGALDGAFHTLSLVFLPVLFYIGIHHMHVFASINAICELLLLFFIPLLFQLYASTRGALWWLAKDPRQFHHVRLVNGAISLIVIILCLEIRVVFSSFGQYIHIPAPWSYFLVSIALLGGALAVGAYGMGMISDAFSSVMLTGAMMLASFSASLVIGLPFKLLPAPLIASFYLSHFCMKKNLLSYLAFAVAASVPVTWFIVHNFWFLNVWLGGVMLKSTCKLLIASSVLALALPGLLLLPSKVRLLTDAGLIAHALLVCRLENRLHNYATSYFGGYDDEEVVYPSYIVLLTTAVGLLLAHRLSAQNCINSLTNWVLTCLYCAKLSMLFLSAQGVLWASVILLLAVSPPILLYRDKLKGYSRMKTWQGFVHAVAISISIWFCRYTLYETLQAFLGHPPSDGLILGVLVFTSAAACMPIVAYHFSHVQAAKRALFLVAVLGACLMFLQPPVPQAWTFWWDSYHMPKHMVDDMAIYGTISDRPHWPSWLLLFTIVASLAAFTSAIPVQYFVELRFFYAVTVGLSLGIYVCTQYFVDVPILHALLVGALICCSLFAVFTHLPSTSSPRYMPWVFALLVALLPISYFVEGQARISMGESDDERLMALLALEGSRASLLGLYAGMFMLIALQVKFELASLLREKVMEKGRNWMQPNESSSSFIPKYRLLQKRPSLAASFTVKKLAAEGSWMPAVGNVATCLCFVLCLILNSRLTGGSNRAIFFLAPILLLLNQDSNLLTGFGDRQRYFPLTMVISVYLVGFVVFKIWEDVLYSHQYGSWGTDHDGPGLFFVVKNILLLLITLPNQFIFNQFMWNRLKQRDMWILLVTPLNLLPLFITDMSGIRALSLLGIMYAIIQYFVSRHVRIAGMRFI